jgi:hypothetical protein
MLLVVVMWATALVDRDGRYQARGVAGRHVVLFFSFLVEILLVLFRLLLGGLVLRKGEGLLRRGWRHGRLVVGRAVLLVVDDKLGRRVGVRVGADELELRVVLLEIVLGHVLVVLVVVGGGSSLDGLGSRAERGVDHDDIVLIVVRVGVGARVRVVVVLLGNGLDAVGPLDVAVGSLDRGGGLGAGDADGLVEPALLLLLGLGELEHQGVEEVGMSDEKAEVVVGLSGLAGELGAGLVGEVVGLGDGHLLSEAGRAERL